MKNSVAVMFLLMQSILCFAQKTADDYLKNAPLELKKDACTLTKEETDKFIETLQTYNESMYNDIQQRLEKYQKVDDMGANTEDAFKVMGKITNLSTKYFEKYYCLTLLCKDLPDLLSGEEIAKATGSAEKIKTLVQFQNDVLSGKANEKDNPDWRKDLTAAENEFCAILSPKYKKVLADDLAEVILILPECRKLGSYIFSGGAEASEIEALNTAYNYLEKYRTNIFLGKSYGMTF
jgi:hypothetical protein